MLREIWAEWQIARDGLLWPGSDQRPISRNIFGMTLRLFALVLMLSSLPAFAQSGDKPATPPTDGASAPKPGEPMKNPLPAG